MMAVRKIDLMPRETPNPGRRYLSASIRRREGGTLAALILALIILAACTGGSSSGGSGAASDTGTESGSSQDSGSDSDSGTGSDSDTDSSSGAGSTTSNVSRPVLRQTLPASWDENWFASPAVWDLNGDGRQEIIAARDSVLYVWDAAGTLLWRAPVGEPATSANDHGALRQYAGPVVGDLDADGYGEIAVAYGNSVALYDHNGYIRTGWPQTFPGADDEIRSLAAADLDDNGAYEILGQKTGEGPVSVAWLLNGAVFSGWPQAQDCAECNDFGGYNQNIGAADFDNDGRPEVVSTYDICMIGIMHADGSPMPANPMFSGAYVSSVPMFHDIDLAIQGWGSLGNDRDEFTYSSPVFGDVDGDGLPELIVYSDHELAGEYVNRGNCLWALNPDLTRCPGFETPICSGEPLYTGYEDNIVQVAPSPALGQLSGDSRPEIVVPSYDGRMRCFSPDGITLWSYVFDTAGAPFIGASGAVIGDLDNDGTSEIVFTTYSPDQDVSHLIILNNAGNELFQVGIAERGSMSPPTLADIDGDEVLEIVISLKDNLGSGLGGVQIWDVPSARINALPWPTGRGNYLRNGQGS